MTMALTLDIGANPAAAIAGVKQLGDQVSDVVDSLDDVGQAGDRAGSQVQSSVDDATKALTDTLEAAVDLGRQMGRTTDQIAQDISDGFDVPLDQAKSAVEEFGSTTDDTARKSGDGLTGLGQIARDVLAGDFQAAGETAGEALDGIAGAASITGPVGTALGALAGFVGDRLTQMADETRERTQGLFDDYVDSGQRAISTSYQLAAAQDLMNDPEQFSKAQRIADVLGIDLSTAVSALVGNTEALTEAQTALNDKMETDAAGRLAGGYTEAAQALNGVSGSMDDASGKADLLDQIAERIGATSDGTAGKVQRIADAANNIPSEKSVTLNAVDNVSRMLDGLKNQRHYINVDVNYRGSAGQKWD